MSFQTLREQLVEIVPVGELRLLKLFKSLFQSANPALGLPNHVFAVLFHPLPAGSLLLIPLYLPLYRGAVARLLFAEVDLKRFDDLLFLGRIGLAESLFQLGGYVSVEPFDIVAHTYHPADT